MRRFSNGRQKLFYDFRSSGIGKIATERDDIAAMTTLRGRTGAIELKFSTFPGILEAIPSSYRRFGLSRCQTDDLAVLGIYSGPETLYVVSV